jgi:Domain of unknown function (DUF397)
VSQPHRQKSSFSTGAANCVELAALPESPGVRIRESDDPAVVLTTAPQALAPFLAAVRDGRIGGRGRTAAGGPASTR